MEQEDFTLTIRTWEHRSGLVHIIGRWDAGSCPVQHDRVAHERTGLDIFVNEVAIGDGPVELVLMCGHAQPALRELKVGDRLVARR